VVVVGGGIAGTWVAFQLVKAGVDTILVSYLGEDRGGLQGASRLSAGALNTSPLYIQDLDHHLQEIGCWQMHPSVASTLTRHLSLALDELSEMSELKPIKIGLAPAAGGGKELTRMLLERFQALGGKLIDGWVTRLIADQTTCRGVQYESREGLGKIRCKTLVIASGGYTGLFANSMRTHCYGNMLGCHLQCGGMAMNLEFLFKHGYGNIDTHALTPTEELPGAEIYNHTNDRISWLEELLFDQKGTGTHLRAVRFWTQNTQDQFYIDLSYRPLYLKIRSLNSSIESSGAHDVHHTGGHNDLSNAIGEILEMFPAERQVEAAQIISASVTNHKRIDYPAFEKLKSFYQKGPGKKFRVRPLTYFSMGGIAHVDFSTNLSGVYVTGEAMHDFGANRVGGLPWSLYLASGYSIAEQIAQSFASPIDEDDDFEMISMKSEYDKGLLNEIQEQLHESYEKQLTLDSALQSIAWFRNRRRELFARTDQMSDGISWLIVAEAIMQCAICRKESRGFFFRNDFGEQDEELNQIYSGAWYDSESDTVSAELFSWEELQKRVRSSCIHK
jgi:4-hydroxybenzoate adenylyltransferase